MPGKVPDTYVQWQVANAEKSFLLRLCFIKWGVNKEVVKLTVDARLCVISPWKENSRGPCGALAETLV